MDENPESGAHGAEPAVPHRQELLDTKQACALLGIKPATLYTYVSRGWLLPMRQAASKVSLYRREELEALQLRSSARAGHAAVAAQAMHFGQPVLTSSITEITAAGPRYRGHLATELAKDHAFETVAELLWSGVLAKADAAWVPEPMPVDLQQAIDGLAVGGESKIRVLRMFTLAATALDTASIDEQPEGASGRYARQLLWAFTGCCGMLGPQRRFIAPAGEVSLARHLLLALGGPTTPEAESAVNTALILGADHELSSPTFAARIAASVGARLQACVVAALATQRGAALAGGGDAVEDLMRGLASDADVQRRIAQAKRNRELLPGFVQPLYPHGDPRGALLVDMARSTGLEGEPAFRFIEAVHQELGLRPNIEIGLVALSMALGLPPRSASALWGIGRTAGWIAHVLEQRRTGTALRPRGLFRPDDN
jgi:citrate synthase